MRLRKLGNYQRQRAVEIFGGDLYKLLNLQRPTAKKIILPLKPKVQYLFYSDLDPALNLLSINASWAQNLKSFADGRLSHLHFCAKDSIFFHNIKHF